MKKFVFMILVISTMLICGCNTFAPDIDKNSPLIIPDNFASNTGSKEIISKPLFSLDNNELDILIKNALENNFGIKASRANIAQAQASIKKENASFWPGLDFAFGGQKKRVQTKTDKNNNSAYVDSHSWNSSLNGSYTLDIWGEAQASKKAQVLTLQALEQDLKQSILNLTSDISETWVDIIATRKKKEILNTQINNNQTLLKLQRLRFINGKANALDVSQQQEALAEASSQMPLLEKQEKTLLNNLAFMSGKTRVDRSIQVNSKKLPNSLPIADTGIPSDLLDNRPDIQAARMRLVSSQWEITAAKADLLPSFKLTAQALFSHGELDLLFQNWIGTLAASIAGPIFDGGYRRAEVARVKAAAEEQVNYYAQTIAQAIFEVENSLIAIHKQNDYIKLLEEELKITRLTLKDASIQYQNGQSSYLSYLNAWTNIERLERQLVGEKATIIKEHIKLNKILGWKPVQ